MATSQHEEKQYCAFVIEWNDNDEEYEFSDDLRWNGQPVEFETYKKFLEFMASLSQEEKECLGLWRLMHNFTGDYITINDGIFDEVSFLSLNAPRFDSK